MNATRRPKRIAILMVCLAGLLACAASTGCDEDLFGVAGLLDASAYEYDYEDEYGYDYSEYEMPTEE